MRVAVFFGQGFAAFDRFLLASSKVLQDVIKGLKRFYVAVLGYI